MKRFSSWLFLLAVGCANPPAPPSSVAGRDRDVVAAFAGGEISMAEIEAAIPRARTPACLAARRAPGGGSIDDLLPCYREVAEGLVLERQVLAGISDVQAAIEDLAGSVDLRRQAYLEVFRREIESGVDISDEQIAVHFATHRDSYRQPGSFDLWNIFRRVEDPDRTDEAVELLRGLRRRFEAGESFAELARAYSQSETRWRGGWVGHIVEGRLPPRLERIAISLEDDGVSDPIVVRDGVVLLHVCNTVRGFDPSLAEVREQIHLELAEQAIGDEIDDLVAGVELPAGAVVLELDELLKALDSGDPDRPVLDIEGDRLTVAAVRQMTGLVDGQRASDLGESEQERLREVYDRHLRLRLLVRTLRTGTESGLQAAAESRFRQLAIAALVDDDLRREMTSPAFVPDDILEAYYRDNLHHYQSPLRLHIKVWHLPFDANPPRQAARMNELRAALVAGETGLAQAVEELGGVLRDLGWRTVDQLAEIRGKARDYLLQTRVGEPSVVFQNDDAFHLLWVAERQEPGQLSFEEVAARVRQDYVRRFEERLFREVADRRLADAGFAFDEGEVRERLHHL